MTEVAHWWEGVDDPGAVRLARRLAERRGYPADTMTLSFEPMRITTPGAHGLALIVDPHALAPLWTLFLDEARQALAVVGELAVEDTLQTVEPSPTVRAAGPDDAWREERGLVDGPDA